MHYHIPPALCNKILQALNLQQWCASMTIYIRHTYLKTETNQLTALVILVFLKQSTCYAITPDTHQWYRINTNKITDNHNIALCNDSVISMSPITHS